MSPPHESAASAGISSGDKGPINSERTMPERRTDPPSSTKRGSSGRLKPEQYELKIRWEKARRVFSVTPQGVGFEFDSPLKVGLRYPISLSAPGVSFSSTLEVTRCRLTVQPEGRYFQIEGKFFPYVE